MKHVSRVLAFLLLLIAITGCGTQPLLLGTRGEYLLSVMDVLTTPTETVTLQARLQGGDFLRGQEGFAVRFYRDGVLYKVAQTSSSGKATVQFTPETVGDYAFTVACAPAGFPDEPPETQQLLVVCRAKTQPLVVVDLDKTVVATGFETVLLGDPQPAQDSQRVLHRLNQTHTIVYLTHRPDYFGLKSKRWLWDNGYPPGPVLLSSVGGFLKGSGAFKSGRLREMTRQFDNIEIGIGDKLSDGVAYHENGLRSFVIVPEPDNDADDLEELAEDLAELPAAIQTVSTWRQIEQGLFGTATYPPADMIQDLRNRAAALRAAEKEDDD